MSYSTSSPSSLSSSSSSSSSQETETTASNNEAPGRYLIVQPAGAGLTMLIDTMTGRSWFRIAAGTDHYAWRPMKFEPSPADVPK